MTEVFFRRVYRTGVQTLEREDGRFYVTLRNRSNDTRIEIPVETARRWYRKMRDEA